MASEASSYTAPIEDMMATLAAVSRLEADGGFYADLDRETVRAILEEAGRFASERLAPLNRVGDLQGSRRQEDGSVRTPAGFAEAYRDWAAAGWSSVAAATEHGGQGLPHIVSAACVELWNAANMGFALNPLLTVGAVEAIAAHGSEELKRLYLPKMVSGEWTGTMNLTEPQAGSDLSTLRTRAAPAGDGTYRITGSKIYISYGEHDLTENIIHLVLARLPDAPPGTRGISLFLVPKFLLGADGSPGARNDVRCAGVEHKFGIHASPTCTMVYGDAGGATGWLVGEENRGLNCMFTMMNNARLNVGLQGVAIADRATQQAFGYARERRQGRTPGGPAGGSPIIEHPDVKRMLLDMRGKTAAARAICYAVASSLDRAELLKDADERRVAGEEASILTPVAKAFSTDIGVEVASTGVQVHGGMGFVEETGAAQHLRDARIAPIYEGTNGIQFIDLVTRKLPLSGGATVRGLIAGYRRSAEALAGVNEPAFGKAGRQLVDAVAALERATEWMLRTTPTAPAEALAGATPYGRLFGVTAGGAYLADMAMAAHLAIGAGRGSPAQGGRVREARFFIENHATLAGGLETAIVEGATSVTGAFAEAAE